MDSKDNVYVFNRGTQPMVVFDRDGNFLRAWGGDIFTLAHGVSVGPDDSIYCADSGDHTVRKLSRRARCSSRWARRTSRPLP